jgi:Calcineurin-like phosphoesterase
MPVERSAMNWLTHTGARRHDRWQDVVAMNTCAAIAVLMLVGCKRHDEPAPAPPPPRPVPAARCSLPAIPLKRPAPKRLVAIGDLHGDLGGMRAALRTAGAIDASDHWIGGDLVVVQTGDVLDRGDDESAMLDLMFRLEREADAAGGALIMLLGNHELMNAAGDFRYVTAGGKRDFGGNRAAALGPGGTYAKQLARHNVVAVVGDVVLSHAGVLGDWVTHVDDANESARCWLDGQTQEVAPVLGADDSPVWTRAYGLETADCAGATAALTALGAKRMVVGHTVQAHINSACGGALWRIDVGLAKVYGGPIEVLELYPETRVLSGTR